MYLIRKILGLSIKAVGFVLIITALLCLFLPIRFHGNFEFIIIGVFLLPVALFIYRTSKKMEVANKSKNVASDQRLPVLYLRSFAQDSDKYLVNELRYRLVLMINPFFLRLNTEEEELKILMEEIGPFIAIGNPKESLPKLGATRLYPQNTQWRDKVIELMKSARCVIIKAANTENLWWEIESAYKIMKNNQIFFLLPGDKSSYDNFKESYSKRFPDITLPEFNSNTNSKVSGVFYLSQQRTIIVNWLVANFVEGGLHRNSIASQLKKFLVPNLLELGVNITYEKAGASKRIKSTLIDLFIIIGLLVIGRFSITDYSIVAFLYYPLVLFFPMICEFISHSTIGKKIYKLKILDENQTAPSVFQLVLRVYFKYLLGVIFFYIAIPIMLLTKSFIYDRISKTMVVTSRLEARENIT